MVNNHSVASYYICLSAEWRVLSEHFNSLCNTLPYNHQLTIDKLRNMVQIIKNEREQLSRLIASSSTDVRKINMKIITYLIVKLCYTGISTSLMRLCDVIDELIDPTGTPTCVQQIRHGMWILVSLLSSYIDNKYLLCKLNNLYSHLVKQEMYVC